MEPKRFQPPDREWWGSFLDEILTVCPRCEATALVRPRESGETQRMMFLPRRVTCTGCGFNKDWAGNGLHWNERAEPVLDAYFNLPLRLQVRCGGHVLWAFNHRHLCFLESFVQASLRERPRSPKYGWHNGGLASRLPRWMKDGHRRGAVLEAIAALRERR